MYADDLCIATQKQSFDEVENTLGDALADMIILVTIIIVAMVACWHGCLMKGVLSITSSGLTRTSICLAFTGFIELTLCEIYVVMPPVSMPSLGVVRPPPQSCCSPRPHCALLFCITRTYLELD